jgi:tRNA pseudouridine55 synthase
VSGAGRTVDGVLVVDKPKGPSSHDVVALARRALGTRAIGHAGTLDPLATGVLVLAVGEGTKLVPYLTSDDKEYDAVIALGASTSTLDAGGEIDGRAPLVEGLDRERVEAAARTFVGERDQAPPAVSAIKVGGERLYRKARRGEVVEVAARRVRLDRVDVHEVTPERISLSLAVGKGFYVRAFARDLAVALGTLGHVIELRRTKSGSFGLERAIDGDLLVRAARDESARATVAAALLSLPTAWAPRPVATLTSDGVRHARAGRAIGLNDLAPVPSETNEALALADESGALVAVARREGDHVRVVRGFQER